MHLLNNLTGVRLLCLQGLIQINVLQTDLPTIHSHKYILYHDPVHTYAHTYNCTSIYLYVLPYV